LRLVLDDDLGATAHYDIDFASRAWDVVSRGLSTVEHFSRVSHLFIVDAVQQPVGKRIATEVAPKLPTAIDDPPFPIDLGIVLLARLIHDRDLMRLASVVA
jgi:hypothetical protein